MTAPTITALREQVAKYVDAEGNSFAADAADQAVAYIGVKLGAPTPPSDDPALYIPETFDRMPQPIYVREVLELAADLFYRRQAKNGIVSVNAMDGQIARVSRDPWATCDDRIRRYLGLGFA